MLVFCDFETFYDSKTYTLDQQKKGGVSMVEFVRDARFKSFGLGIAIGDGPVEWFKEPPKLDWANATVVAHNCKFEGLILAERYGIVAGSYIDTIALAKATLGKTVKGRALKTLAEHFGLQPKGELKTDGLRELTAEQEAELATYCLHDVELCREIYRRLIQDFPENQLPIMDWTIRTFVQPKLRLNFEKLEKAAKEEAERRNAVIAASGYPKEVFSSNPKFAALLEEKGYEVPKKKSPRTGEEIPAFALGDVAFQNAKGSATGDIVKLFDARVAAKSTLLETRATALAAIGRTGAWPFDVEFSGATQTHRFSGGSGAGGNPQNFTRGSVLREAVEAPEGFKLVVGDFAQIEARLVAYLSGDPALIEIIENEPDLYCNYGTSYFKRPITKADVIERKISKEAVLALGYNMGAPKFKDRVKINVGRELTDGQAQEAVQLYRRKFNKVPALWQWLEARIEMLTGPKMQQLGALPVMVGQYSMVLPDGLVCRYTNLRYDIKKTRYGDKKAWVYDAWDKSKTQMEVKSFYGGKWLENICQSLAGVLCRDVLKKFLNEAYGQMHDEVILVVPRGLAPVYAGRLKAAMEVKPMWMDRIKLLGEIHVGDNWRDCK